MTDSSLVYDDKQCNTNSKKFSHKYYVVKEFPQLRVSLSSERAIGFFLSFMILVTSFSLLFCISVSIFSWNNRSEYTTLWKSLQLLQLLFENQPYQLPVAIREERTVTTINQSREREHVTNWKSPSYGNRKILWEEEIFESWNISTVYKDLEVLEGNTSMSSDIAHIHSSENYMPEWIVV